MLSELDGMSPVSTDVYGPYPKSLPDGRRRLSSVSAVIRDAHGRAELVLYRLLAETRKDSLADTS